MKYSLETIEFSQDDAVQFAKYCVCWGILNVYHASDSPFHPIGVQRLEFCARNLLAHISLEKNDMSRVEAMIGGEILESEGAISELNSLAQRTLRGLEQYCVTNSR